MKASNDYPFFRKYVASVSDRPALITGSKIHEKNRVSKIDRRALYADAVGVDMEPGEGVDVVADLEYIDQTCIKLRNAGYPDCYGVVECMSVLEHCRAPWVVAETITTLLDDGGVLFLLVPFIWRYHAYPHDYFRFSADGVRALFPDIEWDCLRYVSEEGLTKAPPKHMVRCEVMGVGVKR